MDKSHSRAPLIFAMTLLLLPVLYLATYLVLVTPAGTFVADPASPYLYRDGFGRKDPYRAWNSNCQRIFWPLEKIDRASRPEAWQPIDLLP